MATNTSQQVKDHIAADAAAFFTPVMHARVSSRVSRALLWGGAREARLRIALDVQLFLTGEA